MAVPDQRGLNLLIVRAVSIARVMLFGLGLHFKMLSHSPFDMFVVVASPLIFATLAYFLFQNGQGQSLLVAALASASSTAT